LKSLKRNVSVEEMEGMGVAEEKKEDSKKELLLSGWYISC
jgi:hypothetical protein